MTRVDPLPAPNEKRTAVREMFDRISPRYDVVNRIMSLGMDMRWRRATVDALGLSRDALVLDLACGTGDICRILARAGYRPIGLDLSLGMLQHAHTHAPLLEADALAMPIADAGVDGITCGFGLRNVTDIGPLFAECARVLRTGGRASFLEIAEPTNPLLKVGHQLYFHRIVPAVGGLFVDQQAYRYLPKSIAYLPEPRVLARMLDGAGFEAIEQRTVGGGAAQIISATRR